MLFTSVALAAVVDGDIVRSGTSTADLGAAAPGTVLIPQVTFQPASNWNN